MLVPAPLLYLAFMGTQDRYFGRWLMPIFPIVCLLAAFFALQLAGAAARLLARPTTRAEHRAHGDRGSRAVRAGGALQRPLRPRALAPGHAQPDACVDGRARPGRRGGRRRATGAGRVGPGRRPSDPRHARGRPLGKVHLAGVRHRRRRRAASGGAPHRWHRGLRADAEPGADPVVRAQRLLLGRHRLRGVRARVRGSRGSPARDRLLPRARAPGRSRLPRLAVLPREGSGRVQLRLDLRLLPARLSPPGSGNDRVPVAWREVRAEELEVRRSGVSPAWQWAPRTRSRAGAEGLGQSPWSAVGGWRTRRGYPQHPGCP